MRITTLLLLAALMLLASACTPSWLAHSPAVLNQAAAPAQPTPPASDFPRGRFAAVSAPNMVLLAIENDGSFRLYLDDGLMDTGKFDPEGPQVLVESMTCAGHGDKPAAYNWLYDDEDGLAFQAVASDPCPERRQYLSEQYQPKYAFVFNIPDGGVSKEWLW
jgi:hypothetical protein